MRDQNTRESAVEEGEMAIEDFQFCYPVRVRYSEIDGQRIVFNAHYLTYFDTAITEYFRWLPFDYTTYVSDEGFDFHTVRTVVEYKKPIFFDEEIEVCVRVARISRASLLFLIEIFGKNDREILRTKGEVVWVHVNSGNSKSAGLPVHLTSLIRQRGEDIG